MLPIRKIELSPVEAGIKKKLKTFWKNTHHLQAMRPNHKFKDF